MLTHYCGGLSNDTKELVLPLIYLGKVQCIRTGSL